MVRQCGHLSHQPVDELTARKVAASSVIPDAIPWDVRHQLKQLAAPGETIEAMDDDLGPDDDHPLSRGYDDDEDEGDDGLDDYEDDDRPDADDIPF